MDRVKLGGWFVKAVGALVAIAGATLVVALLSERPPPDPDASRAAVG